MSLSSALPCGEGETLEKLIKRSGQIEVKLALEIAMHVAAGLAAVHKQKLDADRPCGIQGFHG